MKPFSQTWIEVNKIKSIRGNILSVLVVINDSNQQLFTAPQVQSKVFESLQTTDYLHLREACQSVRDVMLCYVL